MVAYLVFKIVFYDLFESLPIKEIFNIHNQPVQFWNIVICKHKQPFILFIIQYKYFREFGNILVGEDPKRITKEAEYFLKGKGICIQEKNHNYILLYGCLENPLVLCIYICVRYFFVAVCHQYKAQRILFDVKRKKQFITLHVRVGDTIVRKISHLKQV
jgi:hypothetical protein